VLRTWLWHEGKNKTCCAAFAAFASGAAQFKLVHTLQVCVHC
jgi:hypothetical protein